MRGSWFKISVFWSLFPRVNLAADRREAEEEERERQLLERQKNLTNRGLIAPPGYDSAPNARGGLGNFGP